MLKIGCHMSISDGFRAMGSAAVKIDANAVQFFTRNPRGGKAKQSHDITTLLDFPIAVFLGHAPYTMNLCSAKENVRGFSRQMLKEDLELMGQLPGSMYNFHPGSHTGQGLDTGISQIADALNDALTSDMNIIVLLETMVGKGSEIGGRFDDLRRIIDSVDENLRDKLGVCLDTCHVFDGGYDIATDIDGVLAEFDRVVGLDRLRAIHLNDSKNILGSKKDRHETIGNGHIGLDALVRIINHQLLHTLPFYLETPNDLDGYAHEIALLRKNFVPDRLCRSGDA